MKKCSICGEEIKPQKIDGVAVWKDGHNADPVNNGRCCDKCNWDVVVPMRLNNHFGENNEKA